MQNADSNNAFLKGPKRKRLAKACDACHKSKRRCDGTAPCSNCYYASKQCTYTDASGRPVPAPRPFKADRQDPQPSSSTSDSRSYQHPQFSSSSSNQHRFYPNPPPHSVPYQSDINDDEHKHSRKRFRNERGDPMSAEDLIIEGPISNTVPVDHPDIELDPALKRELTNLFFAHCHPARAIIHKPTFSTSLSLNRVPSHLLLAVCALAAPLSKQPTIRTTPSRFAGKPFANEAISKMFDAQGRLIVLKDLATAQALCILQMHEILTNERNTLWDSRFHEVDIALQIVEGLGVHSPEHPKLTPVPSPEYVEASIEHESTRRIFWLIHVLDLLASIFFKKPTTFADGELRLRLPVDETNFELGAYSTLPEYLYLPAVRTQYSSEFGHLIRILSIYAKIECALDEGNDPATAANSVGALMEAEQKLEARQRTQRGPKTEPSWALEKIELILQMLGDRAKNSILSAYRVFLFLSVLVGSALWSLIKYCKRDDSAVRKWATEYEEAVGTKIFELVQDWRTQPSPPQQHQHPLFQSSQHLQKYQQQSHAQQNTYNVQQNFHRRISDARNSGSNSQDILNTTDSNNSRPPHHQHTSEASSYGANITTTQVIKRSPSHSPPISYSLGRQPNAGINANANANTMSRSSTISTQYTSVGLSETPINSSNVDRDIRGQSSANGLGIVLLHSAGSGPNSNESSAPKQGVPEKYHGREVNVNHSRWSHNNGDSGDSGDARPQPGYSVGTAGGSNNFSDPNGSSLVGSGTMTGGSIGSSGGNNSSQRSFANVGDGSQSLPSLKASGLLDSWGSRTSDPQSQNSNGSSQKSHPVTSPRRTTPPGNINLSGPITSHHATLHSDATDLRPPTTLAMPVGLQWLANETR
ncbi:hypothetical protein CVT25_005429 [Psilocybe cyanescens]|uniref:Zn(2)-C6 fungal-type domain-containing protein n=1 Tax=Psilocybe cyanescens TaxID=93625 RepID=A0A409VQW1_PSICY|nr:hypothetical protein CVT25_005429 [Psilocybe cyanescens]